MKVENICKANEGISKEFVESLSDKGLQAKELSQAIDRNSRKDVSFIIRRLGGNISVLFLENSGYFFVRALLASLRKITSENDINQDQARVNLPTYDIAGYIADHGGNLFYKDEFGNSALHYIAMYPSPKCTELLAMIGPEQIKSEVNNLQLLPESIAKLCGNNKLSKTIREITGKSQEEIEHNCIYFLDNAKESYLPDDYQELLVNFYREKPLDQLKRLFVKAVFDEDYQICEALLRLHELEKANVEDGNISVANPYINSIEGSNGSTPLHIAVTKNNVEMAKVFLEHGANINSLDFFGLSPLHYALFKFDQNQGKEMLKSLLSHPEINTDIEFWLDSNHKFRPIELAIKSADLSIIKDLFKKTKNRNQDIIISENKKLDLLSLINNDIKNLEEYIQAREVDILQYSNEVEDLSNIIAQYEVNADQDDESWHMIHSLAVAQKDLDEATKSKIELNSEWKNLNELKEFISGLVEKNKQIEGSVVSNEELPHSDAEQSNEQSSSTSENATTSPVANEASQLSPSLRQNSI